MEPRINKTVTKCEVVNLGTNVEITYDDGSRLSIVTSAIDGKTSVKLHEWDGFVERNYLVTREKTNNE